VAAARDDLRVHGAEENRARRRGAGAADVAEGGRHRLARALVRRRRQRPLDWILGVGAASSSRWADPDRPRDMRSTKKETTCRSDGGESGSLLLERRSRG